MVTVFAASHGAPPSLEQRLAEAVRRVGGQVSRSDWAGPAFAAWCGEALASTGLVRVTEGLRLPGGEGQWCCLEATPDGFEVALDRVGFLPVFRARSGSAHLVSNRVEVLSIALGLSELDLGAAASFTSVGWVTGDRTLLRGVSRLPAGSRWSPPGEPVAPVSRLAGRRGGVDVAALADSLLGLCSHLGGEVEAPLTAGKDSRLLAALLRVAGVRAVYATEGPDGSSDVEGGAKLAAALGVEQRRHVVEPEQVRERWDELAARTIRDGDGLTSLWQVGNALRPATSRPDVTVTGIGGEIARGFYTRPDDLLPGRVAGLPERFVQRRAPRSALTGDAHAGVLVELRDFVGRALGEGFRRADVPDVFYLRERVGGWAAAQSRKAAPSAPFGPLMSGAWVAAAFSLSPAQRWCEPLHLRLLQRLAPDLLALPVESPWRPQRPRANAVSAATARARRGRAVAKARAQDVLVDEALRAKLTAQCLDAGSSPLWSVLDRRVFEAGVSTRDLLQVATLFAYERHVGGRSGGVGGAPGRS